MKFALSAAIAVALAVTPAAQRFTSTTTLLTIDATVTDASGAPVPGLTAADFEVKLNGKTQPVRAVAFLQASSASTPAGATRSVGVASALPPATLAAPAEPRVFVLLLDDLSIRPGSGKGLLVSAERFVSRLPPSDIVGFTTTSGRVTVNPTTDRSALLKRLRRAQGDMFDTRDVLSMAGSPYVGIMEALQIDDGMQRVLLDVIARECGINTAGKRPDMLVSSLDPCVEKVEQNARNTARLARRNAQDQLMAMEGVIRAMGVAGGIKHLVMITGGIGVTHNVVDFVPVAKAASAAGVQLTVLAEEPDDVDMSSQGGRTKVLDERALLTSAETMTDMSGGQFYRVIGQAERFYDRVLQSASAVYRLGVELPSDLAAGADVVVQVAVAKPGLTVHASHHSVAPALPPPPLPVEQQLKNAISSGKPSYAVPLSLDPEVMRTPGTDQLAIRVVIEVPSDVPGPLKGVFALVDEAGALKSGPRAPARLVAGGAYRLEFLVPVAPGKYRLRFAVADANGAVGSIEVTVTAVAKSINREAREERKESGLFTFFTIFTVDRS